MIDRQMRCIELVELLTEWMEGELDDDVRQHVEEHLVICPPCGAYLTQMRLAIKAMQDVDGDAAPPTARGELLRLFRAQYEA